MHIVIIGSGPTALGAAYRINQLIEDKTTTQKIQVTILEKESYVGGLASSVTDARGFTWDLGVHVTGASKYHKFSHVINEAVGKWNQLPRCVKAFMKHVIQDPDVHGNYVPYPVQDSIPYFPDQCLSELEKLSSIPMNKAENFADFTSLAFGETLQREFIRPYNQKVWTVPLESMNCSWVENRVPRSKIEDLKRRSQLNRKELEEEEAAKTKVMFRYPRELCGVGEMWARVAKRLPRNWLRFNANVVNIDTSSRKITTEDGSSIPYTHIISTIPIVHLGKLTSLAPQINLKHSKVVLVGIGLRRPQPPFTDNLSWLYFPQTETTFYRCTFISNFNDHMTPNAALFWSVICEIGVRGEDVLDAKSLVENTIKDLQSHGIIDDPSLVVDKWTRSLPFGYPIPTLERDQELAKCHPLFHKHNIYSRGRFGSWKYEVANQDHCFTMGTEVVDRILFNAEENVFS